MTKNIPNVLSETEHFWLFMRSIHREILNNQLGGVFVVGETQKFSQQ